MRRHAPPDKMPAKTPTASLPTATAQQTRRRPRTKAAHRWPPLRESGLRLPRAAPSHKHHFSTDSPTAVPAAYHLPHEPSMANGMANSSLSRVGWLSLSQSFPDSSCVNSRDIHCKNIRWSNEISHRTGNIVLKITHLRRINRPSASFCASITSAGGGIACAVGVSC